MPAPQVGDLVRDIMGIPSPDKLYVELQRLNSSIERFGPDIKQLAQVLQSVHDHIWQND